MASLDEIRTERIRKLNLLKEKGINPYPLHSSADVEVREAVAQFSKLSKKKSIKLVGRVIAIRGQGALVFFNFSDGSGTIQGMLKKGDTKDEALNLFNEVVDIGDFIEVKGKLFNTKRKEKTILVSEWTMLSKSLRPLPDKWHGLQDVEERYRRRYLDTLMSPEVKERFIVRSKIVGAIRAYFNKSGYMEAETPILQPMAGGASAKPFNTHHNALDIDLNLRIAPELYLKELLIGGFTKVYELGRLFRNEGIDATHNPEFTTIEYYEAYADALSYMEFTEKVLRTVVKEITGKKVITYDENEIDFSKKFVRVPYMELFKRYVNIVSPEKLSLEEVRVEALRLGVAVDKGDTRTKIFDSIYKKHCRPKLIQPVFLTDYPVEFSPLAKRREDNLELIDRFQLVLGGIEIVNAFSELNDPIDQRNRFVEQEKNRKGGDTEAQPKDEAYIEAMEYGMPPAAGAAISIDRLTMLLTDQKNIREVILFPTLRPKS